VTGFGSTIGVPLIASRKGGYPAESGRTFGECFGRVRARSRQSASGYPISSASLCRAGLVGHAEWAQWA